MSSLRDNRGKVIDDLVTSLPIAQRFTSYGIEYELDWTEEAVAAGAKVYTKWVVPAGKYAALTTRIVQMDQERGTYRAFSSFTGGTLGALLTPFKLRLDSTIDSESTINILTAPTTIDQSSKIIDIPLIGSPGQGNVPVNGDLSAESSYRLYPPGTEILIEFENQSAEATYFKLVLKWFEITPQGLPLIKDF